MSANLSINIPNAECVKLFKYSDEFENPIAYLVLIPNVSGTDMETLKLRVDAQLEHEIDISRSVPNLDFGRCVIHDRPPQGTARADVNQSVDVAGSAVDIRRRSGFGRLRKFLLKRLHINRFVKIDEGAASGSGFDNESFDHDSSPNCSARASCTRDNSDVRRGPGGSPNSARHNTIKEVA